MRAAHAKLNSSRGASMLMALLFLMVALVLGAVTLASASANAGRTGRTVKEQQVYYAVSSTAELITADMSTAGINVSETTTMVEQWNKDHYTNQSTTNTSSFDVSSQSKLFYGLRTELRTFYTAPSLANVTETTTIPLSFSTDDAQPPVQGVLTLYRGGGRDYTATFELYIVDGEERTGQMTLTFLPYVDENNDSEESILNGVHTVKNTATSTVSWNEPEVSRG